MKTFFLKPIYVSMFLTILSISAMTNAQENNQEADLNKKTQANFNTKIETEQAQNSSALQTQKQSSNNNHLTKTLNNLLIQSIEQNANRLCTATSFTIQGVSAKDNKAFFFSSDVEDMPQMIQKISKHNKFSQNQLSSFNRIYKISMLSQKKGTGLTEQALVNAAESGNFKIDAKIFCVNNFNLYIEPEVSK